MENIITFVVLPIGQVISIILFVYIRARIKRQSKGVLMEIGKLKVASNVIANDLARFIMAGLDETMKRRDLNDHEKDLWQKSRKVINDYENFLNQVKAAINS